MRLTKTLLLLLFFFLPLIHGRLFETLGIPFGFSVSGNFEFTKSIFFNILSGIIFLSFFCESFYHRKKIHINKYIFVLLFLLFSSALFSLSPFHSLIGDTEKGHTALTFLNLGGIYIVLRNLEKTFLRKLILTSLLSGLFVCLIALKEYFFPSFHYGALGNRALGTFGHPNYLSGYLLLLFPLLIVFKNRTLELGLGASFFITIFFAKSIFALFILVGYGVYIFTQTKTHLGISSLFKRRGLHIVLIGLIIGLLTFSSPEKLHSFLSRFYLWESTVKIIFSDWRIFFFGAGTETLPYLFNSFKVPELYIFENFGYTADRPHNFFLNIFYHFGIFSAGIFIYGVYKFFSLISTPSALRAAPPNFRGSTIAVLLFLIYGIFHYFSIASYVVIILIIALLSPVLQTIPCPRRRRLGRGFEGAGILLFLTISSLTGSYYSLKLYRAEMFYADENTQQAQKIFTHPKYLRGLGEYEKSQNLEGFASQNNIKSQIRNTPHKLELCNILTDKYPSVENLFFCGNIFEELGKDEIAKKFYTAGLQKLPDLWNKDSPYWNDYFIKETITGNRFFSEKFGNIPYILDYLEIENNFVE